MFDIDITIDDLRHIQKMLTYLRNRGEYVDISLLEKINASIDAIDNIDKTEWKCPTCGSDLMFSYIQRYDSVPLSSAMQCDRNDRDLKLIDEEDYGNLQAEISCPVCSNWRHTTAREYREKVDAIIKAVEYKFDCLVC